MQQNIGQPDALSPADLTAAFREMDARPSFAFPADNQKSVRGKQTLRLSRHGSPEINGVPVTMVCSIELKASAEELTRVTLVFDVEDVEFSHGGDMG